MAKIKIVKSKAQAGQASRRVVKAADRTSKSSNKAMSQYRNTTLGKNC
jgi:hypothetical protein